MATKRAKTYCGGMVDNNECHTIISEDRLSQLPDPLIHHIFSFLPTIYVSQMSHLSKFWRHICVSTPFLHFDDDFTDNIASHEKQKKQDMVLNFATNFFRFREVHMQQIPDALISFKFDMPSGFARRRAIATKQMDDLLDIVAKNKVKELVLCVKRYRLPESVFNASSLTVLKLRLVKLASSFPPNFPSLKVLSLNHVDSRRMSLNIFISGCPVIEELHLLGYSLGYMDFAVSGTLRKLWLSSVKLSGKWLDGLISRLPLLEELTLSYNKLENKIRIHSHSLKKISIFSWKSIEAAIRTPNLVCLKFAWCWQSIISVKAPNLLEAYLYLINRSVDTNSGLDLLKLLSNLKFSKKMLLDIYTKEVLIFPKSLRMTYPPPLPNLKHLKVNLQNRLIDNTELRDFLLWCATSVETLEIRFSYFLKELELFCPLVLLNCFFDLL